MWRGWAVGERAESRTDPVRPYASDSSGAGLAREIAERWQFSADALRRGLLNADEESAWRRALVVLAGKRAVGGLPSRGEGEV
jgi:hypothetical protein